MNNKVSKILQFPVLKIFVLIIAFAVPVWIYSALSVTLITNEWSVLFFIFLYVFYYLGLSLTAPVVFPDYKIIKFDSTNFVCGVNLNKKKTDWLKKYISYLVFYSLILIVFSIFAVLGFLNSWELYEIIPLLVFLLSLMIIISNLILAIIFVKKLIKDYSTIDSDWSKLNEKIKYLIKNMTTGGVFEEFKPENAAKMPLETIRLNIIRRTLICIFTVGSYSDETKAMICKYVYNHVIAYIVDSLGRKYDFIPDFKKSLGKTND